MSGQAELVVTPDLIAHGGEAIARWEGKMVFVPYAIPGEEVRVRVVEEKARYARADLLEVLQPSPDRVAPPCPYFGVCGGCRWQHINYRRQLDLRLGMVADQMRRLGRVSDPPLDGIVPADEPWGYLNHIRLYPVPAGEGAEGAPVGLGFVSTDGRAVTPIERCLLAHELVDELHASLDLEWGKFRRLSLHAGINTGERLILLETDTGEAPELELELPASFAHLAGNSDLTTLVGDPYFHECLHGRTYRIFAPSFFPANTAQVQNLMEVVREFCALDGSERVLDLFCGVGAFSLDLAPRATEVVGVEPSPWAAADAQSNGEDLANFTIHEGEVDEVLPALEGSFPVVVAAPPRAGLGAAVIASLIAVRPRRLVYVSDDPATLARDTVALGEAGFQLTQMLALDMLPQTAQVETVALLTRAEE